ncbi:HK97 family phage prohead protease [Aeromonas salmonicida]|uniref:HK97 family phage prohead protease n=1 Tax=Aeromonas salmonicida TaxID=645 RepID=UPI003D1FA9DC
MKKVMKSQKAFEIGDESQGTFTCYGSIFDEVDLASEVVVKGAFVESLERHKEIGTMPIFLWNHEDDEILGKWISAEEDEKGLKLTGQFNLNTDEGRRRYEELKHGDLNGFSIGYYYGEDDYTIEDGITYLNKLSLSEVSLVPFPCNELAQVLEVKNAPHINKVEEEKETYKPLFNSSDVALFAKKLQKLTSKKNK